MEKKGTLLMQRYELGRLLGQGTFAKVYYARSLCSGQSVAIKVIDKEKVLGVGMINQIKREISVMRLVRHPHVVRLHEVMATKAKIYIVMEYVKGGELFDILARGRLQEDAARRYFQQLVGAVEFCHSRGVYHRDLKPENLLVDENGDLKVSDFGLSTLGECRRQDGLLHTTCGTPAYVAPEVINQKGYDGAKADIWSCGVILFVFLAGYLPFRANNLAEMYRKISKGQFRCPHWFPGDVRKLLASILDPNPTTRISMPAILEHPWFRKGFHPMAADPSPQEQHKPAILPAAFTSLIGDGDHDDGGDDDDGKDEGSSSMRPTPLNAFDIISQSPGFDLSGLFDRESCGKEGQPARFTTQKPAAAIVSKLEEIAQTERLEVKKKDGIVKLQGCEEGRKGPLAVEAEIFEVTPSLHVVEVKKSAGDTMEYERFCRQGLRPSLRDIVWAWTGLGGRKKAPQTTTPASPPPAPPQSL